ncbi:MAG: pirin family protein [Candidatus Zixiibacteriota bacterium]|jgi:redox-sensitive bicupin YhaK (pirin superfamily)
MITIRRANERGNADHGWLNTFHTFSFNTYHDPKHMHFRVLRVINEDFVQPGQGFGTHPHRDMEIITYVLEGALEHKDSMGNGSVIRPGDVQRMSAGSGVLHSEFNPSDEERVHLLQIWLFPKEKGIEPGYEQKTFSEQDRTGKLRLIASPDGKDGSLTINQDASVYASILNDGDQVSLDLAEGRYAWVQVARGSVALGDDTLDAGDGAAVSDERRITLTGRDHAELILFDLP